MRPSTFSCPTLSREEVIPTYRSVSRTGESWGRVYSWGRHTFHYRRWKRKTWTVLCEPCHRYSFL